VATAGEIGFREGGLPAAAQGCHHQPPLLPTRPQNINSRCSVKVWRSAKVGIENRFSAQVQTALRIENFE
jgi:hypothetical protein